MTDWRTMTVEDCLIKVRLGSNVKLQTQEYRPFGRFPIVDQGQSLVTGWTDDERGVVTEGLPYVVFGDHTRVFKFVDFPFVRGADGTQILKPAADIDPLYFCYALRALDLPSRGYNRHFSILKEKEIRIAQEGEQSDIAHVLKRAENAVEVQAREIDKWQDLKRAAMARLFTRGLKGEAQKETEIGLVPESWGAEPIAKLTNTIYRYPTYYNISYQSDGVPEIRGELLKDGGEIENDLSQFRFIDDLTAARFPKVRLKVGDIVMSVRGTMGKVGIVRDIHVGAVITANLIRLAPNSEKIVPEFFKYALTSERFLDALNRASPQTTIKTITAPDLKSLPIPTPSSLDEQREIVAILDAIDRKIDLHKRKRAVLDELFKSLLHKLMTGEIRVADLDLSALEKKASAA